MCTSKMFLTSIQWNNPHAIRGQENSGDWTCSSCDRDRILQLSVPALLPRLRFVPGLSTFVVRSVRILTVPLYADSSVMSPVSGAAENSDTRCGAVECLVCPCRRTVHCSPEDVPRGGIGETISSTGRCLSSREWAGVFTLPVRLLDSPVDTERRVS